MSTSAHIGHKAAMTCWHQTAHIETYMSYLITWPYVYTRGEENNKPNIPRSPSSKSVRIEQAIWTSLVNWGRTSPRYLSCRPEDRFPRANLNTHQSRITSTSRFSILSSVRYDRSICSQQFNKGQLINDAAPSPQVNAQHAQAPLTAYLSTPRRANNLSVAIRTCVHTSSVSCQLK